MMKNEPPPAQQAALEGAPFRVRHQLTAAARSIGRSAGVGPATRQRVAEGRDNNGNPG